MAWLATIAGIDDQVLSMVADDDDVRTLVARGLRMAADGVAVCCSVSVSEFQALTMMERAALIEAYKFSRGHLPMPTADEFAMDLLMTVMEVDIDGEQ